MNWDSDFVKALNRATEERIEVIPSDGGYICYSKRDGSRYSQRNGHCTCTGYGRWNMCKHAAMSVFADWLLGKAIVCEICGEIIFMDKAQLVSNYPYPFREVIE